MRFLPRRTLLIASAAAPLAPRRAAAQDLPPGPIRLVVGFAPGGGIDSFARLLARHMSEQAGRAVVVDNRPGAGGTIAAAHVARAAPDGTTLLVGENGVIATARAVFANLPFDPERDLAPVTLAVTQTVVIAARPGVAADLPGLVEAARRAPGRLSYASAGAGNPTHLFAADFARRAGVEVVHVPYRGGAQMATSLLQGETHFGFFSMASALPHIRSGALVPLAVGDAAPHPALLAVPSAATTLPGFAFAFWYGLNAPSATPEATIDALQRAARAALFSPELKPMLEGQGLVVRGTTPAEYGAFASSETLLWSAAARAAGVKPE
jgi:tripartite-type tricarboxylate transporter receptor subunit TctC